MKERYINQTKSLLIAKRGREDQINRIRNERASETAHQVEKLAA